MDILGVEAMHRLKQWEVGIPWMWSKLDEKQKIARKWLKTKELISRSISDTSLLFVSTRGFLLSLNIQAHCTQLNKSQKSLQSLSRQHYCIHVENVRLCSCSKNSAIIKIALLSISLRPCPTEVDNLHQMLDLKVIWSHNFTRF